MKGILGTMSDHPAVDLPAAAALTIAYWWGTSPHDALSVMTMDRRFIVYQTLAGVAAGLFGLVFTAVAILRGLSGGLLLRALVRQRGKEVTNVLASTIRALGVSAFVTVAALATDNKFSAVEPWWWAIYFCALLSTIRLGRMTWLFGLLLRLHDADLVAPAPVAPVTPRLRSELGRRERATP